MKISRFIVQASVIIVILISFVLTFLILTNNTRYQMERSANIAGSKAESPKVVKKQELYAPSQIIWNDGDDLRLVYNNKQNIVSSVQKDMSNWKFNKVSVQSKKDTAKYKEFLNTKDSLQLFYPSQMSLSYYGQILKQDNLDDHKKYMFNRVLFQFDKKDKNIYLGNDTNHTVYKLSVDSGSSKNIMKLLKNTDVSLRVKLEVKSNMVAVEYLDRVQMNPYSYLVTKQEDNSYISSLLGSNNISTRKTGDVSTYSSSTFQRLVSNSKKNELSYYDYAKDDLAGNKGEMLDIGYKLINQINSPLSNAKLASVDWDKKILVYREYVEGFPTFKKSDFGAVKISFNKSDTIAQFSNQVMQVPVPSDQKPVTLKSTSEVMENLKNYRYDTNKIKVIELGYNWNIDKDNKDVVDSVPSYFFKVDDKWYTLKELIGITDQIGGE